MENNNTKKVETYQELKKRHHDELNEFQGMFFAFSNEQLKQGMIKLGLKEDDYGSLVSIGAGGYLRKDKRDEFKALFARHEQERKELKKDEARLVDAIAYELSNHEYCITGNAQDALDVLGYTLETVPQNVLKRAIKKHNELHQYA